MLGWEALRKDREIEVAASLANICLECHQVSPSTLLNEILDWMLNVK